MGTFLKHWEETRGAYRDGWSYKEIWRIMHRDGLVDFGYSSFIDFAKKLGRHREEYEKERSGKANNSAKAAAVAKAGMAPPAKAGATRVDLPRFGQEAAPQDPKRF